MLLNTIDTKASAFGIEHDFGKKYLKCEWGQISLNHPSIDAHEAGHTDHTTPHKNHSTRNFHNKI